METCVFVTLSKKKWIRTKNGFQLKGSLIMASSFVYLSIECPSFSFRTRSKVRDRKLSFYSPFSLISTPANRCFEKRTPSSKRCQNLIEDQCIYANKETKEKKNSYRHRNIWRCLLLNNYYDIVTIRVNFLAWPSNRLLSRV